MPDELDPILSRWFAEARQPLDGAPFQAQLAAELLQAQSRSWRRGYSFARLARAASLGIAAGLLSPFKLRFGYSTALVAMALVATALVLTLLIGLQTT
jgi:hypothetical protein